MLFDRFIFVVYTLFSYSWFLLGMYYHSDIRFVSLVSMICSFGCVIIIVMCQLQKIFLSDHTSSSDRWSTVLWSVVHLVLSMLMLLDGLEIINPLLIFGLAGVVLTIVVVIVGSCSCHVILRNSHSWTPHIQLTCVSFWVVMQYMSLRFPQAPMTWMTTPPVACMALVRAFEWCEDRVPDKKEGVLWATCCLIHILYDTGDLPKTILYWGMVVAVSTMCIMTRHHRDLLLFITVPFIAVPIGVYMCVGRCIGLRYVETASIIVKMYEDMVHEPDIEHTPLDTPSELDWDERL